MKIQAKLNFAISSIIVGFALSFGAAYFVNATTDTLKDLELQSLEVIKNMFALTDSTKGMIVNNTIDLRELKKDWNDSIARFDASLRTLHTHRGTRLLDAVLKEEIDRTAAVWDINARQFEKAGEGIQAVIDSPFIEEQTKKGLRFIAEVLQREDKAGGDIFFTLLTTQGNLQNIDLAGKEFVVKNLTVVADDIRTQAQNTRRLGRIFSLGLAAILLAASFLFVFFFSRGLAKRIRTIEDTMRSAAARDLTVRTFMKGRDEIGTLSTHINSVLETLSGFFGEVRAAVRNMESMKESLSSGSTQSAAALNQITRNIESMRDKFAVLDRNIAASTEAVGRIVGEMEDLSGRIGDQSRTIEDSSSAIEEMTASISNVAKLSEERKNRAVELQRIIEDGGDKVTRTHEIIKSVSKEIGDILGIIEIINNVSAQTNLLSMNAAIESAHAGEAGRGFAVVADEIRKLAESTSRNSAQINKSLKSMTGKITEAMEASDSSSRSFGHINSEVRSFSDALQEIASNMEELAGGGRELLKGTGIVSEITGRIRGAADAMNAGIREIRTASEDSRRISAEGLGGMNEIEKGSKEILTAIIDMTGITETTRERMEYLRAKVDSFTTDTEHKQ